MADITLFVRLGAQGTASVLGTVPAEHAEALERAVRSALFPDVRIDGNRLAGELKGAAVPPDVLERVLASLEVGNNTWLDGRVSEPLSRCEPRSP